MAERMAPPAHPGSTRGARAARLALAGVLAAALGGQAALAAGLEIDITGEAEGTVVIDLLEDVAPQHVERITALAAEGLYDSVVFHRVIEGFMAQTGGVEFGAWARTWRMDRPAVWICGLWRRVFRIFPFERGVWAWHAPRASTARTPSSLSCCAAPASATGSTRRGPGHEGMEVVEAIRRGAALRVPYGPPM